MLDSISSGMETVHFFEDGFEIVNDFISENWRSIILNELETSEFSIEVSGIRNINKKLKSVGAYLNSPEFKEAASTFVPADAQLVRAILFNKSPDSNWFVTWHQDKTVSVSSKFEEHGWGAWSLKENTLHVQPPLPVLASMVTIRIHLDSTPKENGCLKVIPNSHTLGILSPEQINAVVAPEKIHFCEAEKRAALIMRPLLLHSSSKSSEPSQRRVLHIEFSNWKLPGAVFWG